MEQTDIESESMLDFSKLKFIIIIIIIKRIFLVDQYVSFDTETIALKVFILSVENNTINIENIPILYDLII